MRYNYLLEVQVLLKIEFYKSLTMKYHLGWGIFLGTHLTLRYMILILFHSPPSSPLIWLDDCVISHYCAIFYENCAISNLLFLVQKLMSRKFYFLEKVILSSVYSVYSLLSWKSHDLTYTKYGSRETLEANKIPNIYKLKQCSILLLLTQTSQGWGASILYKDNNNAFCESQHHSRMSCL